MRRAAVLVACAVCLPAARPGAAAIPHPFLPDGTLRVDYDTYEPSIHSVTTLASDGTGRIRDHAKHDVGDFFLGDEPDGHRVFLSLTRPDESRLRVEAGVSVDLARRLTIDGTVNGARLHVEATHDGQAVGAPEAPDLDALDKGRLAAVEQVLDWTIGTSGPMPRGLDRCDLIALFATVHAAQADWVWVIDGAAEDFPYPMCGMYLLSLEHKSAYQLWRESKEAPAGAKVEPGEKP